MAPRLCAARGPLSRQKRMQAVRLWCDRVKNRPMVDPIENPQNAWIKKRCSVEVVWEFISLRCANAATKIGMILLVDLVIGYLKAKAGLHHSQLNM